MADLCVRIKEWLRNMGYDGQIPGSLNKICNPSTAFIWEQIISNVKPKQDVANIKRNIIIHRLEQKSLEDQHEFDYPIKEIEVFAKKESLESKVRVLENAIEEKETLIDDLLKKNKITYVTIDNIKGKVKENREKKFLLEQKCNMIKENIRNAPEILTSQQNVTSVELDDNSNGNEIIETLQKCSEKLQKVAQKMSFSSNMSQVNRDRSFLLSVRKPRTPQSAFKNTVFSKYLNQSVLSQNRSFDVGQMPNVIKSGEKGQPKRESLGLIPTSYLDCNDDDDDVFLLNPSSSGSRLESLKSPDDEIVQKLFEDEQVNKILKDLLYRNNRQLITQSCQKIYESLHSEIRSSVLEYNEMDKVNKFLNEDDLCDLYFLHVKKELEKDKYRVVAKKLQESIKKRKEEIYSLLCIKSKNTADDRKQKLELQVEESILVASNNFLRQKINSFKKIDISDESQVLSLKTRKIKEEILLKTDRINGLVEHIYKVFDRIKTNREEVSSCVKAMSPYIFNVSMASRLREELNFKEIEMFGSFPLEYNRKFVDSDPKCFYRDVCDSTVPSYLDMDADSLKMITVLMDIPFSTAESIVANIIRAKIKLNVLRSLQEKQYEHENVHHTYSLEELSEREKYVEVVVNTLNSMINSSEAKQVLSAPNLMKEVVDLWTEMPLGNFISEKRLVESQNYKYYEKTFENLYNNV